MVIIEGPDGGGKTTLALKFAEDFGLVYSRPPRKLLSSTLGPQEGLFEWWWDEMEKPLRHTACCVYDRCTAISDPIYSAVMKRHPIAPHRYMIELTQRIQERLKKGWLIFCIPDPSEVYRTLSKESSLHLYGLSWKDVPSLINQYALASYWWGKDNPVVNWNRSTDVYENLFNTVKNRLGGGIHEDYR